jgi:hypothetical protein
VIVDSTENDSVNSINELVPSLIESLQSGDLPDALKDFGEITLDCFQSMAGFHHLVMGR